MNKDFWKSRIYNALELVNLNPTNRGVRALKSMIYKYEKAFKEKLNITLPLVPKKDEKRLFPFNKIQP